MKKTNFDLYLEEQLKDPEFAARFERAGEAWDVALQLTALREKAGLFTQRRKLQRHVPRFTRSFKPFGKVGVFQLFFQIKVKVGLFHGSNLSCPSRIRSCI